MSQQPKIYLGDRGFLKRYGSPYSQGEIRSIACRVLRGSELGLASGDWPSALAIDQALGNGPSVKHVYHSRFLIRVLDSSTNSFLSVRDVQQHLHRVYSEKNYYFFPDEPQIAEDAAIIQTCKPGLVTIGGDWLDILLAQQKFSLANEILDRLKVIASPYARVLLLSFRKNDAFLKLLSRSWIDGVALPVNILNMQDASYLDSARSIVPLYGVHCLAGGQVPLIPALDYALRHMKACACILGATSEEHISQLILAANSRDFSRSYG